MLGWQRRCWAGREAHWAEGAECGVADTSAGVPLVQCPLHALCQQEGWGSGLGLRAGPTPAFPLQMPKAALPAGASPEVPAGIPRTSGSVLAGLSHVTPGKRPHWKRPQSPLTNQPRWEYLRYSGLQRGCHSIQEEQTHVPKTHLPKNHLPKNHLPSSVLGRNLKE